MIKKILLAPAGWEERSVRGAINDLTINNIKTLLLPYSAKYAKETYSYRQDLQVFCQDNGIDVFDVELNYDDDISLYQGISSFLQKNIRDKNIKFYFNVTSTPRDFIWFTLHFLSSYNIKTYFSYYRPVKYASGNLSCNAGKPRLVLKRSGIVYPDKQTCILALSGYDAERLSQLKYQFEPKKILIGRQVGEQLENIPRNVTLESPFAEEFKFDCYDVTEKSLNTIVDALSAYNGEYNILAASLGPKPCAITLFYLTQAFPEVGLVYIPANDYSMKYSEGIDFSTATYSESPWGEDISE